MTSGSGEKGGHTGKNEYTVATLTSDITSATQAKDSYVRESRRAKKAVCSVKFHGITALQDSALMELLQAEGLSQRPELAGSNT